VAASKGRQIIANAVNLIDGLDGLATGIVGIAAATFLLYAVRLGDAGVLFEGNPGALLAVLILGICVGFLPHNIHPARIMMGDGGSMLLGLLIALGLSGGMGLLVLGVFPMETVPGPDGFVTRGWVWPMWQAIPWVFVQAFGSVAGVFLIIKAYQLGDPSHVSVYEYSVMIFGPLFAWVAFGQQVTFWQVIGIALIALAGGIIAVRAR